MKNAVIDVVKSSHELLKLQITSKNGVIVYRWHFQKQASALNVSDFRDEEALGFQRTPPTVL